MAKIHENESDPYHDPEEEPIDPEEETTDEEASEDESPQFKKITSPSSSSSSDGKLHSPPSASPVSRTVPSASSSSGEEDDEEEGSDSDSDSDMPVKKFLEPLIKPIATKPMTSDPPKSTVSAVSSARKSRSKVGSTTVGAKRAAEKEIDTKKPKKKSDSAAGETSEKKAISNDDPKKQLFQRLWSEEDEIVILKGILDYTVKKKADPVTDIGAFLEFIKKSLHIDVTKQQLQDKVRRLKKKYENNASKEKNGKERTFSKAHEQTCYVLSKKIWGKTINVNGNVTEKTPETPKTGRSVVRKKRTPNVAPKANENNDEEMKEAEEIEVEENGFEVKNENGVNLNTEFSVEWILSTGAKVVKGEKGKEMRKKWKKVREQEMEVFMKRNEVLGEYTKLVLAALKNPED